MRIFPKREQGEAWRAETGAWKQKISHCLVYIRNRRKWQPQPGAEPAAFTNQAASVNGGAVHNLLSRAFLGLLSILSIATVSPSASAGSSMPLALHPENQHYFLFRGKPTALITSGEHYGAVLNLEFDYVKYLDTLAKDGLNLTRTFSGAYVEPFGAFNIASNTLAPRADRFICPWARGDTPGYANGGNKFDLTKWDEAYLERLKDCVAHAGRRGVVVEMNLFCPIY